jgi:hypothetical protein
MMTLLPMEAPAKGAGTPEKPVREKLALTLPVAWSMRSREEDVTHAK